MVNVLNFAVQIMVLCQLKLFAYDFDLHTEGDLEITPPEKNEEIAETTEAEQKAIDASVKKWKKALKEVGAWLGEDEDNTKQ